MQFYLLFAGFEGILKETSMQGNNGRYWTDRLEYEVFFILNNEYFLHIQEQPLLQIVAIL